MRRVRILQEIYESHDQARGGEDQASNFQRRTRKAGYHQVDNDNTVLTPLEEASLAITFNLALTHFHYNYIF